MQVRRQRVVTQANDGTGQTREVVETELDGDPDRTEELGDRFEKLLADPDGTSISAEAEPASTGPDGERAPLEAPGRRGAAVVPGDLPERRQGFMERAAQDRAEGRSQGLGDLLRSRQQWRSSTDRHRTAEKRDAEKEQDTAREDREATSAVHRHAAAAGRSSSGEHGGDRRDGDGGHDGGAGGQTAIAAPVGNAQAAFPTEPSPTDDAGRAEDARARIVAAAAEIATRISTYRDAGKGVAGVSIELRPDLLAGTKIDVERSARGLTVTLAAGSSEVRDDLDGHADLLRSSLADLTGLPTTVEVIGAEPTSTAGDRQG